MRKSPALFPCALLGLLALSGCLGSGDGPTRTHDLDRGAVASLALTEPVVLTTGTHGGFEPSIEVGPDGIVYVTAATTGRPGNLEPAPGGARLASWLWYSQDNGTTWNDLPSPVQAHTMLPGLEGDITVDGEGRLYFVDTYLADNTLSRWSQTPSGPAWDFSRPVQGTTAPMDDRPWLAAHGDGIVYLVSNNGAALPSPERLVAGDTTEASKWLHRSEDGGGTWSLGHGFDDWCYPAADPSDDHDVIVTCIDDERVYVHESHDRGRTWDAVMEAALELGPSVLVPGAAVDGDGTRHAAWLDDDSGMASVQDFVWYGETPGHVRVAHARDGGDWTEPQDITPFEGRFGLLHSAAGSGGVHAIVFYATPDLTPDEQSAWTPHLLLSTDANGDGPVTYRHIPLLSEPAGVGTLPPRDFFQVAVGPDDTVHAILQRDRTDQDPTPGDGIAADLLYVRTTAAVSQHPPAS